MPADLIYPGEVLPGPEATCGMPGPAGRTCGRLARAWHPGRDVPACAQHLPRPRPGQLNPSPCCALTMKKDGNKWRCPCGYRWSD